MGGMPEGRGGLGWGRRRPGEGVGETGVAIMGRAAKRHNGRDPDARGTGRRTRDAVSGYRIAVIARGRAQGGSVANVAGRQASQLARLGGVYWISDGPVDPGNGPVQDVVVGSWAPALRWSGRVAHVLAELRFAVSVAAALRRRGGAIGAIVAHGHLAVLAAVWAGRRGSETPVILVTHGDIRDRPAGTYSGPLSLLYKIVTPLAYRIATDIVALSPHMFRVIRSYGVPARKIHILPNGLDTGELANDWNGVKDTVIPRDGHHPGRPVRVLYVGRLAPEKDVGTLLHAAARADRALEKGKLLVSIAGNGPQRTALERLAGRLGLGQAVRFLGRQPRHRLWLLYRSHDVLCIPSVSDPLPTVALEGLAAGIPVIAASSGGLRWIIRDGWNGRLVAPGDGPALAEAIVTFGTGRARPRRAHWADGEGTYFNWDIAGSLLRRIITSRTAPDVETGRR